MADKKKTNYSRLNAIVIKLKMVFLIWCCIFNDTESSDCINSSKLEY